LHSTESWQEIANRCSGCNRGPIITLELIETQIRVTRI
jgi:hypothetical protein